MPGALIRLLQLYREIPVADQELIAAATVCRTYRENEILAEAGKICRELFFISEGVLRIRGIQDDGEEVIHYFLRDNQFCTILNSFNNQEPALNSIEAACDTAVIVLGKQQLDTLFHQLPYIKELITRIIQEGLLNKIDIRNAYRGLDAAARYQLFLLRQPEIALRVSLTDIAAYLGITPQSLSRIRKNIR